MKYKKIEMMSKEHALIELASNDSKRISKALLSLTLHENDYDWLSRLCIRYLNYDDRNVQSTAIQSIGHIARLHGRIDKTRVIPILEKLKKVDELSGKVEDALDDISMFAG